MTWDCAGIWVLQNCMLHFDSSEGVRRPFGDIHANCIAYTVGLIAVDSHRLKKKTRRCRCMPLPISFWMVRICSDKVQVWLCARQFFNVQNVAGQTTDVWFLLGLPGNVVDASTVRFFTFIWHTAIIPASCTSRCSQHVVIFSIHLYTNLGFRCQHPSPLWYRLAPSKALQVGVAVERLVVQDVVTTEASHVGTSTLLDSYVILMGGLWEQWGSQ
jgi:hypothetical protein